jgi:alpha-1,2-rhamnosyltransferase
VAKRLLLDATKTFEGQFTTGIQRVVRELVQRSGTIGRQLGMEPIVVVASGDSYYRLDTDSIDRLLHPVASGGGALVTQSPLAKRIKAVLQLNAPIYATMQRLVLGRRLRKLTQALAPVETRQSDVIALIDYFGAGSPSVMALAKARRAGAAAIAIVFDIIPLLHPGMVPATTAYPFKWAFGRVVRQVDGLITISKSSADEIRSQPVVEGTGIPVKSFYLGQDIRTSGAISVPATIPSEAWAGGPTFVMIGTIEPRKRHAAILAAFDRLWSEGYAANLVLIGRIGWEIAPFLEDVRRHPLLGKSLFLCHNVGDEELQTSMRRADASIMASKAEGFGLPIVESLALGVPVLTSDIAVFREIAGQAGCYFPDDTIGIADAIKSFIDNIDLYKRAAGNFQWIDWDQSATEFADALRSILNEKSVTLESDDIKLTHILS